MYRNPFYLGWNKGWSFLFFLEGGIAKIEAKGFGISITTKVEKGESPLESADRLVSREQRLENQDIILGLDLLMKNNKFSSSSIPKVIC